MPVLSDNPTAAMTVVSDAASFATSGLNTVEVETFTSLDQHTAVLQQLDDLEVSVQFLRAKVGTQIARLHDAGAAPQVSSVFKRNSRVTATTAQNMALETQALQLVPELTEQTKPIGSDYLEITTRQLTKLEDDVRSQISGNWLVKQMRELRPDHYRRVLIARIEQIDADARRKQHDQAWRNSEGSIWHNKNTGEVHKHTRYAPHEGEMAAKLIQAEMRRMAATNDGLHMDRHLFAQAELNLLIKGSATNGNGAWGNNKDQPKPLIEIVADAQTFTEQTLRYDSICETSAGTKIPIETLQRHTCDATIRKVLTDNTGIPINVGRKYRTATDAQRTAARAIYATCGWDDCQNPFDWCQIHHIQEWDNNGPTNFNNLIPLCSQHHHKVHEGRWTIKLNPDRSLTHIQPNGKHYKTGPPPTRKPPNQKPEDHDPWPQPNPPWQEQPF